MNEALNQRHVRRHICSLTFLWGERGDENKKGNGRKYWLKKYLCHRGCFRNHHFHRFFCFYMFFWVFSCGYLTQLWSCPVCFCGLFCFCFVLVFFKLFSVSVIFFCLWWWFLSLSVVVLLSLFISSLWVSDAVPVKQDSGAAAVLSVQLKVRVHAHRRLFSDLSTTVCVRVCVVIICGINTLSV